MRGNGHLESAEVTTPQGTLELSVSAIFVFIGQQPRTAWLEGVVARDTRGFVLTGSEVGAEQGWNLDDQDRLAPQFLHLLPVLLAGAVAALVLVSGRYAERAGG